MEASSDVAAPPHVLVLPDPAQGHIIPLLDFAHDLAGHGLSITVAVTTINESLLRPLVSRSPTIQTLVLPFPSFSLPPPSSTDQDSGDVTLDYFFNEMHALSSLRDPLLHWARSHPSPPDVIVSDFFYGWTNSLASELGIPRVVFCASGASMMSVLHCLWKEMPERTDTITFSNIPNSPTFRWPHISPIYSSYREGNPVFDFFKDCFLSNIFSWGFVINTFAALEDPYLEHMRRDLGHPRLWAVGPIGPANGSSSTVATDRGGASSVPVDSVLSWLDTCPEGSVVYVCFGSIAVLKKRQMEAVAAALERSKARFVWCTRTKPASAVGGVEEGDGDGVVPEGLEERMKGRGVVIRGWAPQVAILSHRAVGSFLTHCGWNSTLEGIATGVVLLTWPMSADQFINARLLVDEMGVAVKACVGADEVPDPDELGRVMAESVSGRLPESGKALELKRKAVEAVGKGGSSHVDTKGFVDAIRKLKDKRG